MSSLLRWPAAAAGAAVLLSACAPAPPIVIRAGYVGERTLADLPSLLAHEALAREGIAVEVSTYSRMGDALSALAGGRIDVLMGSTRAAWGAAAGGVAVRTVMSHAANELQLVVSTRIRYCRDLGGRRLGLPDETAAGAAFARAYFADVCPDATPDVIVVPDVADRVGGLTTGALDAAVMELSRAHALDAAMPRRFYVLADFADRWPSVRTSGVHVRTAFAGSRPELLVRYVRARLVANRRALQEATTLQTAAERLLPALRVAPSLVETYRRRRTWSPDGGLTAVDVDRSLQFFVRHAGLDPGVTAAGVADLSLLAQASSAVAPGDTPMPHTAERRPQ